MSPEQHAEYERETRRAARKAVKWLERTAELGLEIGEAGLSQYCEQAASEIEHHAGLF